MSERDDGYDGNKDAEHEQYLMERARQNRRVRATRRKKLSPQEGRARKKQAHKQRMQQRRQR